MAHTLSVTEVARHFAEYINRVGLPWRKFRTRAWQQTHGGTPPASCGETACGTSLAVGIASPSLLSRSHAACR